jgi:outer membrane protein assembly factor BamB
MTVLRLVGVFSVASLLLVSVAAAPAQPGQRHLAAPPTTVSSRYVVAGDAPFSVLRVGKNVYVAGVSRVTRPTGSAVILSAATGQAEPVAAQVAGGSVRAAIADNAGGWYIGGNFTSIGGLPRPGLAHLLADGTLDTAFAPPDLGQVNALVLDAGRLYAGGLRLLAAAPFLPFLSALDPATGALLPVSYPPLAQSSGGLFEVVGLAAADGRVYAAFNSGNGIATYDEDSGALLWNQPLPACDNCSGLAAFALADGKLLVGGQFSTGAGAVDLEELDPTTGTIVGQPAVGGPVTGIATAADTAYVVAGPSHHQGLWTLDLSSGTLTRRAPCQFCSAVTTDGTTLYASKWAPVGGNLRVYALNLHQTNPILRPLSQVTVGGSADTLALQNGRLLIGGSFLGLGGVKRSGLAAFDARTGALLPWRPAVQEGGVGALAHSGTTIYLGGPTRIAGKRRDGLAAVSALGKGKLLPWHPRLSHADIHSLAVADGRVFVGGLFEPYRAKPSSPLSTLVAFSAKTGRRLAFKPKPRINNVQTLAIWHRLLLVGAEGDQGVSALRAAGDGRTVWRKSVTGGNVPIVFALQTDGSRLYVGGRFNQMGGQPRTNLAALALDRSGELVDFAPRIPNQVMALARTDYAIVFGTMAIEGGQWWLGAQALGAVSADGQLLPWQIEFPPSDGIVSVEDLAVVPGGLVASGGFSWIGPIDRPAPGSLVWLR